MYDTLVRSAAEIFIKGDANRLLDHARLIAQAVGTPDQVDVRRIMADIKHRAETGEPPMWSSHSVPSPKDDLDLSDVIGSVDQAHPWVPGACFISRPRLKGAMLAWLREYQESRRDSDDEPD